VSSSIATTAALARWCTFLFDIGGDTWGGLRAETAHGAVCLELWGPAWTVRAPGYGHADYTGTGRFTAEAFDRCPVIRGASRVHGPVKALLDDGWVPRIHLCRLDTADGWEYHTGRTLYWYHKREDASILHWADGIWAGCPGRLSARGIKPLHGVTVRCLE